MFAAFKQAMGTPEPGTAATLDELRLSQSSTLRTFGQEVGFGRFKKGLFSVVSVRERLPDLGGWERVLPANARPFASSAFGVLFLSVTGEDVWVLETQYGSVTESDMPMVDVLNLFADEKVREEELRQSLFDQCVDIKPTCVLSPTPAIALAGYWSWECMREMSMGIYLSFTAGLTMENVIEEQRKAYKEWQEQQARDGGSSGDKPDGS